MSRTLDPQLSFADLELSRLGVHLDPLLQGIDAFLDSTPLWSSTSAGIWSAA